MLEMLDKAIIQSCECANIPRGEILYLHVRLRGLTGANEVVDYSLLASSLVARLRDCLQPKAILIPSFTYSFTKTGVYNRVRTPSEVGRFGEEVRCHYAAKNRTMNPVFSVVDVMGALDQGAFDETSAFGRNSLLHMLHEKGHVVLNINTPCLISTYFHFLEALFNVDYRYPKEFVGRVSSDGEKFEPIRFEYVVRNLELDTTWRRKKIEDTLFNVGALRRNQTSNVDQTSLKTGIYGVSSRKLNASVGRFSRGG